MSGACERISEQRQAEYYRQRSDEQMKRMNTSWRESQESNPVSPEAGKYIACATAAVVVPVAVASFASAARDTGCTMM